MLLEDPVVSDAWSEDIAPAELERAVGADTEEKEVVRSLVLGVEPVRGFIDIGAVLGTPVISRRFDHQG